MRLLTVCTSKGRPEMLFDMVSSFMDTKSSITNLVLSFDEGDPCIDQNINIANRFSVPHVYSCGQTVTQHVNGCYEAFGKDYDYFHITNDDVVYKTEGWDLELISRLSTYDGIAYGNDLLQGKNLPTFPLISRKMVQILGWLQLPTLSAFFGDMVWRDIGQATGRLHYVDHVILEHRHWINGKRTNDNPDYDDAYKNDQTAYAMWVWGQRDRDIKKLKEVLNGNKKTEN